MKVNLYELFLKTLNAPYLKVGESTNYAFIKENDTLNIYFEDSKGKEDWKNNLDFPVKAYNVDNKITWHAHRGFLKVFKEIEKILPYYIEDKSIKSVIISGYSHGAAIAVLCHEYVWYNRPDLRNSLQSYGFGCPRVLWGSKTKEIIKRWESFTVIRNIDDIVTHLPPKILGYFHVGNLIEIGKRGKYSSIDAHRAENILTELKEYNKNTFE
jgi:predicted lipase